MSRSHATHGREKKSCYIVIITEYIVKPANPTAFLLQIGLLSHRWVGEWAHWASLCVLVGFLV